MQDTLTMDRLNEMRGQPVYDSAGQKIGKVEEIFYDNATGQPEWIGIGVGMFGTKRVLVPVTGASASEDGVSVRYDKAQVKDSPDIDGDEISGQTEQELYAYYGLTAAQPGEGKAAPGRDKQTGLENVDEASMIRSEEELTVGKRDVDAGSVRLRKWVETEPVEAQIELERETAHVNREPINEPSSGGEIGEQTIEVNLRGEEAVSEKRVVAKERISLDKDVEKRQETVTDDVRKERVEFEGDITNPTRDDR